METEVTRYGFHTESRMRENCTYGSMRGRAFPTGRPALLYTLLYMFYCICLTASPSKSSRQYLAISR
jgi:hypothetical protein